MEATRIANYRTKQDLAYLTIKDSILSCHLAPGERLVIRDLAARLNVSETPVRVALTRLAAEGLVESVSHVGAVVGQIRGDEIEDVHILIGSLAGLAAQRVAARHSPADAERIRAALAKLDALPEEASYEDYAVLNHRFHRTIYTLARSTLLASLLEQLFDRLHAAHLIWSLPTHRQLARVEHAAIVRAIDLGLPSEARAAEEKHWQRAGRDFQSQVMKGIVAWPLGPAGEATAGTDSGR